MAARPISFCLYSFNEEPLLCGTFSRNVNVALLRGQVAQRLGDRCIHCCSFRGFIAPQFIELSVRFKDERENIIHHISKEEYDAKQRLPDLFREKDLIDIVAWVIPHYQDSYTAINDPNAISGLRCRACIPKKPLHPDELVYWDNLEELSYEKSMRALHMLTPHSVEEHQVLSERLKEDWQLEELDNQSWWYDVARATDEANELAEKESTLHRWDRVSESERKREIAFAKGDPTADPLFDWRDPCFDPL